MNEGDVVEVIRGAFHTGILVAGPALIGSLVTGLVVSILQTLTQVQEMTLANVPKIVVTVLLTMLFLPFSFSALRSYMEEIVHLIVGV